MLARQNQREFLFTFEELMKLVLAAVGVKIKMLCCARKSESMRMVEI